MKKAFLYFLGIAMIMVLSDTQVQQSLSAFYGTTIRYFEKFEHQPVQGKIKVEHRQVVEESGDLELIDFCR